MLFRLQSNNESSANWTNTFDEDILIPPMSSVALMSLSCLPSNNDVYIVGDGNSRIGLKYGAGSGNDTEWVSFSYGVYTKALLADILQSSLNYLPTFGNASFTVGFTGELLKISYSGATGSLTKYLVFDSLSMANSLGFDKQSVSKTNASDSFTATSAIQLEKPHTGNLVVELPSLGGQIQCYDSVSKSKHQIIASIPTLEQHNQTYTYQNNSPVYLDLNNRFEMNLRQISVRVLLWNNTPLPIENNGCWITLSIVSNK
jgi:hypothetical protein